ncbi:hypothetical protein [Nocardiopsis halotolerans]|uniref:hypothetical protein n=1 Tax=Nocardiopsis halotolerans TaxID=124252 RepID=UPI000348AD03|nr:hypothetical protein [Nocardiopsis halotolerans]
MRRTILTGAALLLAVTACGEQTAPPDPPPPTPRAERSPEEGPASPAQEETEPAPEEASPSPDEGSPAADEGAPHVLNRYGDENGFDDQRPTDYVATEFTTFSEMEWHEWSEQVARGEGELSGTWCMEEGCQNDPYDVEVELGDPVEVDGTTYYSTYTIVEYDEDMSQEMRQALEEADGGRLTVPGDEPGSG